jgi:hypothetical protein
LAQWNDQVVGKIVHSRDHMVFFNTVWPNQLNLNTTAVFGVDGTDPIALSRATVQLTRQAAAIGEFAKRNKCCALCVEPSTARPDCRCISPRP